MPGRTLIALTAALAMSLAATAPASAQAPDQQEIGLLFAQTATRGSLHQHEGESRYALTLHGVAKQTVWFSDRPARQAGHIPTPGFVRAWDGFGFAEDPPNAALTVLDAADHQDTAVLTLGGPRYDGKTRTVRYPAQVLDAAGGNLSHFEPHRDAGVPRRFDHASLFIDDAVSQVIDGCAIKPYAICVEPDLQRAQLVGANLYGATLVNAYMNEANLYLADLRDARLVHADLSGAILTAARLSFAKLNDADLSFAKLDSVDLRDADLSGADLSGAVNLERAALSGAVFCRTTMPDGSIRNGNCK